jgi:hypothetical protein
MNTPDDHGFRRVSKTKKITMMLVHKTPKAPKAPGPGMPRGKMGGKR